MYEDTKDALDVYLQLRVEVVECVFRAPTNIAPGGRHDMQIDVRVVPKQAQPGPKEYLLFEDFPQVRVIVGIIVRGSSQKPGFQKPGFGPGELAPGVTHSHDIQPVLELSTTEELEGAKFDDFHVRDGGLVGLDQDAVNGPHTMVDAYF